MSITTETLKDRLPAVTFENWRDYVVILSLVGLIVLFGVTTQNFLTVQNIINILRQTAIVALLGVGVTFTLISAEIDISIGAIMALSAVVAGLAMTAGYGVVGGIVGGLGVGIVLGAINGFITVRVGVPSFLVTLGMLGAARGLALIITGTQPIIISNETFLLVFGGYVGLLPIIIIWTALVLIIGHFVLSETRFGRHVYAAGDNAEAASYTGIKTARVKFLTLAISGATAGFAGLLVAARLSVARPTIGSNILLAVIAAVIIGGTSLFGGRGWMLGTIIGALLLTVINNGLILNGFGTSYQQFIRGIVIVLAVAFRSESEEGGWI
jgi:ribose transport system permease protein